LAEIKKLGLMLFNEEGNVISYKAVYEEGNRLKHFYLEKN